MKNKILFATFLTVGSFCFFSSCADKLVEPDNTIDCATSRITYNDHVKGILDAKCNLSGCHDDNFQISFGAFSTLSDARKQDIYTRVCVTKNMPPAGMTSERVDTIRCWSENGYLEN
ncbi:MULTISPECIES: hypothetical protein [unclassified Aureispira]|uniref:hypothetical protein n=1 Tax=unclassified Aureispira TaxID=2649989 RepID=UPI00069919A2|nr:MULTISPECIES: hypothetical protein [unclassified Aureispira]WMX15309.1 hypothetical protein QP953_02850 [Aureispira sp. CCB-E]